MWVSNMKNRKIGLVVVNYNDYQTTSTFIEKMKQFNVIDLIVIVDNASTDDSYNKLVKYRSKKIELILSNKNGGYGYGNNLGINYLIKKLGKCNILVSNPDIEVEEKVVKILSDGLDNNEKCAVIAPIVLEKGIENKGWKLPTIYTDILLNIPYFHRYFRKLQLYNKEFYNHRFTQVDCVSGCFFMVKSEIMEQIGFFDQNLFLYYEENVIGKKIKNIGKKILIDNSLKIKHNHSISINNSLLRLKKYQILKKSQLYYHENYNNIGIMGKTMLTITVFIARLILKIYYETDKNFKDKN